jgi:hypothetical protein
MSSALLWAVLLGLLGLGTLADERLVDVGDHTAASDSGLDESVELLVSTNSQLQMAGRDTLHAEIAGGIAGKLEHLSAEVLIDVVLLFVTCLISHFVNSKAWHLDA